MNRDYRDSRDRRAIPAHPACPVFWVKRAAKVNQPEKVPPDLKDLQVYPDFLGRKASPATPACQDHPVHQDFQV